MDSSVVLPEPEGPTSATISGGANLEGGTVHGDDLRLARPVDLADVLEF